MSKAESLSLKITDRKTNNRHLCSGGTSVSQQIRDPHFSKDKSKCLFA
jgi:hypothetical protein